MANKGLYKKYIVQKADGSDVDPSAQYFVLRVDADRHAKKALWVYANSIKDENPELACDIVKCYGLTDEDRCECLDLLEKVYSAFIRFDKCRRSIYL